MTTVVNRRGQITIPAQLRRKYGFLPGTKVVWIERDGELIPQPVMPLSTLAGFLRPREGEPSLTDVLLDERRRERNREDV